MFDSSLLPFFQPQGVAVIGVSRDPAKLGYGFARNLLQSGYEGAVHFVSARGDKLLGRPIYNSVRDVPDPVDLALVFTPAATVPAVIQDCGERGIKAVVIGSGGFRETGLEGAELEKKVMEIARAYHIRLIGPNCIGLSNTHLPLDATFLQPPPAPRGHIAFLSHSGAICAAIIDWVRREGYGFSHLVSLGNQADVCETDLLPYLAADRHTEVITLYMEGVQDGRRFVEHARAVSKRKPILALKVGRFEAGIRAAQSHTGALAGSEAAYDAAFRRAGVIRATTTLELIRWAGTQAWSPLPEGRRVAILTNAGGPGVTAADALEMNGLRLADLSETTRVALAKFLPPAASLRNPVDMLAGASPSDFAEALRLLLGDPGVDSVMIIAPPPPASCTGAVAKHIIPVIQANSKPVFVVFMGDLLVQEGIAFLRASQVPVFQFPEPAAAALSVLMQRSELLKELEQEPRRPVSEAARDLGEKLLSGRPSDSWLEPGKALDLLELYGIPTVQVRPAKTAEQAVSVAEKMGFPVVVKVASPDISHKSDVGGVRLNVPDGPSVRAACAEVMEAAQRAHPGARIAGVHVQKMLSPGQEVIIGVIRDPQFGPLVMFGSGGVEVEGLKDVAFALAPLTLADADRLLESTWAGRKLKGFRNLPAADREAVRDVLFRLAQLADDFPEIAEMEINPLRVMTEGDGAFAIDVRVRMA